MVTDGQPDQPGPAALPPPRAVVFDLFITLTDWGAERRRPDDVNELASALGLDPAAFTVLMRATFGDRVEGRMGDPRATLAALAAQLGRPATDEQLESAAALRTEHTRRITAPRAGVIDGILRLRGLGYRIGVLSDCTSETVELWPALPYAGVVDAVTFSCVEGRRKPHPDLYAEVARRLGVATDECVYVGDGSSAELTGAAAAGMTPVLLETPFGLDFRYDAEPWTGRAIRDIDELAGLLRELTAVAATPTPGPRPSPAGDDPRPRTAR